ncbi:MAG TPA: RodZ domain-containing protein [Candidatus Angelobacter sp.]|nr:RodZ domain-containing protein [Candidatus Angelobacter sp.]
MGSFGERLRREREMRGVSLDDIAEATKIGTRLLRALEDEHFDVLPGGIFNKGFVRAYAKYLGLNEDEMVADYLQAAGESSPDPRVIAEQNSSRIDRVDSDSGGHRMAGFPIIPVLILLVVIAAGAGGWHIYQDRMQERRARADAARLGVAPPPVITPPASITQTSPASTSTQPATQPSAQPATTTPSGTTTTGRDNKSADLNSPLKPAGATTLAAGTTSAANPTGQSFEVTIKPKDNAWVSIKVDGKIVVRGIIGPADVKTVRANEQVVVWTGNAGAIDLTFNGQPVPLAGGPNEVAVEVITPKGATAAKPPAPKPATASPAPTTSQ